MTNRANRRRKRAAARRRDDAQLQTLLARAREHARDLGRRGSVFDLADTVENEATRAALRGALVTVLHEELLEPLTTTASRRRRHEI